MQRFVGFLCDMKIIYGILIYGNNIWNMFRLVDQSEEALWATGILCSFSLLLNISLIKQLND